MCRLPTMPCAKKSSILQQRRLLNSVLITSQMVHVFFSPENVASMISKNNLVFRHILRQFSTSVLLTGAQAQRRQLQFKTWFLLAWEKFFRFSWSVNGIVHWHYLELFHYLLAKSFITWKDFRKTQSCWDGLYTLCIMLMVPVNLITVKWSFVLL